MRVLTRAGSVLGGADAAVYLARELGIRRPWWGWLLVLTSRVPFGMRVMRAVYRWVAARRHCLQDTCQIPEPRAERKEGIP